AMASTVAGRSGPSSSGATADEAELVELLRALKAARDGDFSVRLPARRTTLIGQIGAASNELVEMNGRQTKELARVARRVGREGRMSERFEVPGARGSWAD